MQGTLGERKGGERALGARGQSPEARGQKRLESQNAGFTSTLWRPQPDFGASGGSEGVGPCIAKFIGWPALRQCPGMVAAKPWTRY